MLARSSKKCWPRMAEYRLTPAAEHDLETIWTHTAQQWGVEQANRYTDVLTATFAELAQSPKSAPTCGQIRSDYPGGSQDRDIRIH